MGEATSQSNQIISSLHIGSITGFFWVLMLNGFVGYQFVEDGGAASFFGIFVTGLIWFVLATLFALDVPLSVLGGFGMLMASLNRFSVSC